MMDWRGTVQLSFSIFLVAMGVHGERVGCDLGRARCADYNVHCGLAFHNYQLNCRENLSKTGVPCQQQCVHAIITLSTFAEGFDYLHCKCEGNLCQKSQDRINRCLPNIVQLNRTDSIIPCEHATFLCTVKESCLGAWQQFDLACAESFATKTCSEECANARAALYKTEFATFLSSCQCVMEDLRTRDDECEVRRKKEEEACPHQPEVSMTQTLSIHSMLPLLPFLLLRL